jgi:hypothetical protein
MPEPITWGVNLGIKLIRNRKKIKAVAKAVTAGGITAEAVHQGILSGIIDSFLESKPVNQDEDLFLAKLKNSGYATVESENIQNLKNKVEDEFNATVSIEPSICPTGSRMAVICKITTLHSKIFKSTVNCI